MGKFPDQESWNRRGKLMMCRQLLKDMMQFVSSPDKEERSFKKYQDLEKLSHRRTCGDAAGQQK